MSWDNCGRIARTCRGWDLQYFRAGRLDSLRKGGMFIAARHWNSDTPAVPRRIDSEPGEVVAGSIGGGYFLNVGGLGIAVDPGIGFLKSIYERHGIAIQNIDLVIITHNHEDHCADCRNIINFTARRDPRPAFIASPPVVHQIRLMTNAPCLPVVPGDVVGLFYYGEWLVELQFLPALHWQYITTAALADLGMIPEEFIDYHMTAIGLRIELDPTARTVSNRDNLRNERSIDWPFSSILITGDTMFPLIRNGDFTAEAYDRYLGRAQRFINLGNVTVRNRPLLQRVLRAYFANFLQAYRALSADLACFHLGSLETAFARYAGPGIPDFQYEGLHLGLLGILRLYNWMNGPSVKLGIITEWGEELRGERKNIARFIQEQSRAMRDSQAGLGHPLTRFIPSDVELAVDLESGLIRCSDHPVFHSYDHMDANEKGSEYLKYLSTIRDPAVDEYERTCDWEP